jgi:hypothetical protein
MWPGAKAPFDRFCVWGDSGQPRSDLHRDFEGFDADMRADGSDDGRAPGSLSDQPINRLGYDTCSDPPPTCVDCRDGSSGTTPDQYWYAVCGANPNGAVDTRTDQAVRLEIAELRRCG